VLEPLPFNSYINPLAELKDKVSDCANVILYANDLVYVPPIHTTDAREDIQKDIDMINECFRSFRLKLNANRVTCTKMKKLNFAVNLNGSTLETVSVYNYLNIHFDDQLSFGEHTISFKFC
jgi:hypothetical protein